MLYSYVATLDETVGVKNAEDSLSRFIESMEKGEETEIEVGNDEEVRRYYGQEVNEGTLQQTEYDLLISVFTMEELENNELLLQLLEMMNYWAFVGERIS